MTFREAQMDLTRIASMKKEEYVKLIYSETCVTSGQVVVTCEAYVHGYGIRTGATWEEIVAQFSKAMGVHVPPYQGPEN